MRLGVRVGVRERTEGVWVGVGEGGGVTVCVDPGVALGGDGVQVLKVRDGREIEGDGMVGVVGVELGEGGLGV